jgi:hypothetical protein
LGLQHRRHQGKGGRLGAAGVWLAATAAQHADGLVIRGLQKDASLMDVVPAQIVQGSSEAELSGRSETKGHELMCCEQILLLVLKAGDRTRTGDVQLGKLTFYH